MLEKANDCTGVYTTVQQNVSRRQTNGRKHELHTFHKGSKQAHSEDNIARFPFSKDNVTLDPCGSLFLVQL